MAGEPSSEALSTTQTSNGSGAGSAKRAARHSARSTWVFQLTITTARRSATAAGSVPWTPLSAMTPGTGLRRELVHPHLVSGVAVHQVGFPVPLQGRHQPLLGPVRPAR